MLESLPLLSSWPPPQEPDDCGWNVVGSTSQLDPCGGSGSVVVVWVMDGMENICVERKGSVSVWNSTWDNNGMGRVKSKDKWEHSSDVHGGYPTREMEWGADDKFSVKDVWEIINLSMEEGGVTKTKVSCPDDPCIGQQDPTFVLEDNTVVGDDDWNGK